ncbi:MAG: hypothetical protein ACWIPJ_05255 [Polaribacter sp.]
MVNIPKYNPNHANGNGAPFIDNFQEVPCDYEEPVTEPVNLKLELKLENKNKKEW